jgi:nucleotide-binding universal stress UspA family protein
MKTILVPTDFSKASLNAIDYAAKVAMLAEAKLLFHAYHVPVITTDLPVVLPSLDEMEADTKAALVRIQNQLHIRFGYNLQVECESVCGFAADLIEKYAKEKGADLIVMGMQGVGLIEEKLIGSVTTSVIHSSKHPVLVIGEHVTYKAPKQIVLAADFEEIRPDALQALKGFAYLFGSHIFVLNIAREAELVPTIKEAVAGIKIDRSLESTNRSFHGIENENIIDGINNFIEENKIDMVVMVPRKHSLVERVFSGSKTRRMAFHSSVPLLTLNSK